MSNLTTVVSVAGASFVASFVEAVEALTVVLAVGLAQGWRPALTGAAAALAVSLAARVAVPVIWGSSVEGAGCLRVPTYYHATFTECHKKDKVTHIV